MKKLIPFLLLAVFAACSNEKPKDLKTAVTTEENLSAFIEANPRWTNDEATEAEITDKFKHKVINWSNEPNFLKNMPLQLMVVRDTAINNEPLKMAIFKGYTDKTRPEGSLLNFMQLEIQGIVSDAQLKNLTVNKHYTINGNLYKQGKRADVKFIHLTDFKGYDLGKYIFLITEFKQL